MKRLLTLLAVTAFIAMAVAEVDAGLFFRRDGSRRTPLVTAARVVAAPVRAVAEARAAAGRPVLFPRLRAAACVDCSSRAVSAACAECETPQARAELAAAEARNAARRRETLSEAGRLDGSLGHRLGRGPFYRAANASAERQSRIVERFNSTIGERHEFRAGSFAEIIQWIADHPEEILRVVMLIIQIIGLS